jgi:hypothetical protein
MPRTTRPRNTRLSSRTARSSSRAETTAPEIAVPPAKSLLERSGPKNGIIERRSVSLPVSNEQIEAAAYALWQMRGGSPEQNWFEAEATLRLQAEMKVR